MNTTVYIVKIIFKKKNGLLKGRVFNIIFMPIHSLLTQPYKVFWFGVNHTLLKLQ